MKNLDNKTTQLRKIILDVSYQYGGHVATAYSCLDIIASIYYGKDKFFNPDSGNHRFNPYEDIFILSKGHGALALYAVLADLNFFPQSWLDLHYKNEPCYLGGHVDHSVPGVHVSTGSLGHGLGLACGYALASKLRGDDRHHYVLLGDGECTEGSVWEAAIFAKAQELKNLTVIVDMNQIGATDYTKIFCMHNQLPHMWKGFGWDVVEVNGHDCGELLRQLSSASFDGPRLIVARTIKGKGVSIFENDPIWHVKPVDKSSYEIASLELSI